MVRVALRGSAWAVRVPSRSKGYLGVEITGRERLEARLPRGRHGGWGAVKHSLRRRKWARVGGERERAAAGADRRGGRSSYRGEHGPGFFGRSGIC